MTIETLCRDCVFAEFSDNTQVGCTLNQLDRLEEAGAEVIEAVDENEKEFFLIRNLFCRYWRDKNWLANRPNVSLEGLRVAARDEMKIHYDVVIIANDNLADLQTTLESLKNQAIHPKHITVLRYNDNRLRPPEIIESLRSLENIPWRNQNLLHKDIGLDAVINTGSQNSPIVAVFNAGFSVPSNFFTILDILVNDDLLSFALIEPNEDGNGLVVSSHIFKLLNGNYNPESGEYDKEFATKLKEAQWAQMIYPINKLFDSFPQ
jgi:hypothetical protein